MMMMKMMMGQWAEGLTVSVYVGDFPTLSLCKFMQRIQTMFTCTNNLWYTQFKTGFGVFLKAAK